MLTAQQGARPAFPNGPASGTELAGEAAAPANAIPLRWQVQRREANPAQHSRQRRPPRVSLRETWSRANIAGRERDREQHDQDDDT